MFKPMLAGKVDFNIIRFPLYASVKIDGIRCIVRDGVAYSRSNKPLPNKYLQNYIKNNAAYFNNLDGELIVGNMIAPDCYRTTVSEIMSEDKEPDFTFWVFDNIEDFEYAKYYTRIDFISEIVQDQSRIKSLKQTVIHNQNELDIYEEVSLIAGHEGIMLRDPYTLYKQGRSTSKSQELLKVKRFEDAEAIVIGVEEEMYNGNFAQTNELGRTKRSSHQENKTGNGVLGALIVKGLTAYPGVEFNIGTGFNDTQRAELWNQDIIGKIVKFKHFPVGVKKAPRHPVFLGFRSSLDI